MNSRTCPDVLSHEELLDSLQQGVWPAIKEQRWGLEGGGEVRLRWSAKGSGGLLEMVVVAGL
ncbi:hypothetical protein Tco_0509555, partial [Tanacetum coccineum]